MFALRRRFRILLLCFFLCFFPALSLLGQSPSGPTPAKPDYSQEAFVVEQSDSKVQFENDGTYIRTDNLRVRIQSDAAVQAYGVLSFPYEDSTGKVEIDYVRVRKPDGSIVTTPSENLQDMAAEITRQAPFYSDLREKHVAVKGLSAADVLEYQAHWTCNQPLVPGQFWYASNFPREGIILEEQLAISVPRERPIKVKSPDLKPVITDAGKYRTYIWSATNLQHKDDHQKKEDQAKKAQQQARGQLPLPDIMLSSFQTWEEVGRWYGALQAERVKPSPEIRAKAAELTKNAPDETAKIRAIYTYVSIEFHYIGVAFGIGRYQPHAAAEILENRYGDCKDKHTLLASLLEAAGIKAYPALINGSQEIDPDVPSPGQFNHVITVVPQGKDLLWLDTTAEVAPFGYLLPPLRDKHALVIPEGAPPAPIVTPADPPTIASQTFKIEGILNDSGTLDAKAGLSVQGSDAEVLLRAAFRRVPMPQWKELIQQMSYTLGFSGDVTDVTVSSPEKLDEPFHFSYKYTRKDYPDWGEKRISSPLPSFLLPAFEDKDGPPPYPIWLGAPQEVNYESHVEIPKTYAPELPKRLDLKEDFAEFHTSYSFKDGVLSTERHMTVKRREVPVDEYEAYKKFSKAVAGDHDSYVAIADLRSPDESFENAIWALPYSDKPDAAQAYDDARDKYQRRDTSGMVESLKHAVEIDPKFIRAWLWLANIYRATGRTDDAINTWRKAIANDPDEPLSYKILGTALMRKQKYEDAVAVFRQLIEVAPQDIDGPGNLGFALLRVKLYEEAALELESAARMDSQRPGVFTGLGSAYLHAGDQDKAVAAYKRALEIAPEPGLFNNCAYELADENKQLPLALEWAKKAVQGEEEASSKTDFAKLQLEDLGHPNQLAADWDTLGWVYFRMGDLNQAEKYLRAAWMLSLGAPEKDHLAQVHKQQHKKFADDDNAIRTVRLARLTTEEASAEFFVVFSRDAKTSAAKVEDVKFINGSDKLKSAGKALTDAKFEVAFPDDGPTRLVRRGILGCYQYTGCSFVMLMPDTVHSLN